MKKYLATIIITALVVAWGMYFLNGVNTSLSTKDIKNNPAQATAFVYVSQNSEIDFRLKEVSRGVSFAIFEVIPRESNQADTARIILKNNGKSWEVIGFWTAFPGLEDAYPELKGKI